MQLEKRGMIDEVASVGLSYGSRVFSWRMVLLLAGVAVSPNAIGTDNDRQSYAPPPESIQTAHRLSTAFTLLADRIPGNEYDVYELVDHLNYDFDTAVEYVTEYIAFDPYVGVMRGPAGTLKAGAGSAWDKSLLLAALINTMAGEARIVQGTITEDDARRLLDLSLAPLASDEPPYDVETAMEILAAALGDSGDTALRGIQREFAESNSTDSADIKPITEELIAALEKKGFEISDTDLQATETLVAELAGNYAWVRYRDGPSTGWIDVHPAFGTTTAPTASSTAIHADAAPESVQHSIELSLEIEVFDGRRRVRKPIMEPVRRPVANLSPSQISLGVSPHKPLAAGEPEFFIPILNGELPSGAIAFTLEGLTASAADALAGPDVFATIGGKMSDADAALSGLGAEEGRSTGLQLTGLFLRVEAIDPGGRITSEERQLKYLDLLPNEKRARALPFYGVIDVSSGRVRPTANTVGVLQDHAKRARTYPYFSAVLAGEAAPNEVIGEILEHTATLRFPWLDLAAFRAGFEGPRRSDIAQFRTGPFVVMRRINANLLDHQSNAVVIDVLHNPSLVLRQQDDTVLVSPRGSLAQGVRETIFERFLIGVFDRRFEWEPKDLYLVQEKADLERLKTDAEIDSITYDRMNADLSMDSILLASRSAGRWFWWRVNTESGLALGMTRWGGSETTEYATLKSVVGGVAVGLSFLLWDSSVRSCEETYAGNQDMILCCQQGATLLAGAGVAFGRVAAAIGYTWQSAVGIVFERVAFEAQVKGASRLGKKAVKWACSDDMD